MSFSIILIAIWLYAGRAILLFAIAGARKQMRRESVILAFVIGVAITPAIVAITTFFSSSIQAAVWILVSADVFLLVFAVIAIAKNGLRISSYFLWAAVFAAICLLLAYWNGPFIEHLTDAWWHMRYVSWHLNNNDLILPVHMGRGTELFSYDLSWLGVNCSSYRLQAILAWISSSSIVESWYASTVSVCGLLGISTFLLFSHLTTQKAALSLSLILWMLLLGSMSSGFRLMGWPAGIGYVLLNLGLIASFQLNENIYSRPGWILLLVSAIGISFFHLAEIFLLIVAFACLLAVNLIFNKYSALRRILVLSLLFAAVILLMLLAQLRGMPLAKSVYFPVLGFVFGAWLLGVFSSISNGYLQFVLITVCGCIIGIFLIDWSHLESLFQPEIDNNTTYYSGYIPKYVPGLLGDLLPIPKWEHQLRASLLWSGVLSIFIVAWISWQHPGNLSRWLVALTLGPILILVSPPLFSISTFLIPVHGGYRVQFLMPISIVIGIGCVTAYQALSKSGALQRFVSLRNGNLRNTVKTNSHSIGIDILVIGCIALICIFPIFALRNFDPDSKIAIPLIMLVLFSIILSVLRFPYKSIFAVSVIVLSALAVVPDGLTRFGVISDRTWAIHSNIGFHWRIVDNRDVLRDHTSWRYQADLKRIQDLVKNQTNAAMISDLATSYYSAAETTLRPLVQQSHHSNRGAQFSEYFLRFCSGGPGVTEFKELITEYNESTEVSNDPPIRFIIINHDTSNYTAEVHGAACVGETEHIYSNLSKLAEKVFEGEFLSLWKLRGDLGS